MTPERLAELHEAAKYALSHGNGQVTVPAKELIEVLPALPVEEKAAEPELVAEVPTIPVPETNAPELAGTGIHAVAEVPAAEVAPAVEPAPVTDAV
jgi:hypothetical protein